MLIDSVHFIAPTTASGIGCRAPLRLTVPARTSSIDLLVLPATGDRLPITGDWHPSQVWERTTMRSVRTSISTIGFFFVLFFVCAAHAGPLITARGQTLCIDDVGNGIDFDWELRPEGGGTAYCSGTENVSGTEADVVAALQAAIDLCASDISAYPTVTLGSCPGTMTGFTVARGPDSLNWELAIEDNTNPPNLKVATPADPVFFNPSCRPSTGTPKPIRCNGSNPCCDGGSPPCNPVPEPGAVASLLSGCIFLFGLDRIRKR
jgi:hypothetical protein